MDINQMMDIMLEDVGQHELPVELINHVCIINRDGDVIVLTNHQICRWRAGTQEYQGYEYVAHAVDTNKFLHAASLIATSVWKEAWRRFEQDDILRHYPPNSSAK